MILPHRRQFLLSAATVIAASLLDTAVLAQGNGSTTFTYRGYKVDMSAAQNAPNRQAIEDSLRHQIDIAADCGAEPKVLDFFKSQEIFVKPGEGDGGGHFSPDSKGVSIDATVDPPEKPIVLHELLHAYHARVLPGARNNPDLLNFYNRAKDGGFYPPDSYVLKNVGEFFAVTASLYLWGNVDRPPRTRANLRQKQPAYYKWLGELFGVQKDA
jgi:hypothetical protein